MGEFVRKFKEINKDMVQVCGGKASHLGELTGAGFNVPSGFCVISSAFFDHLEENAIYDAILEISNSLNYEDITEIQERTKEIRSFIENAKIPARIESEILQGYHALAPEDAHNPFVAIRSSVAVKDTSISSFPGMMDTYHYIRGDRAVVDHVKRCWASVWSDRAVFGRKAKGVDHDKALICPIVQVMINSECAGIIFTANPVTSSMEEMVIESNWGIGESVVSGEVQPDHFVLDKSPLEVKTKTIAKKTRMIAKRAGGGREWFDIDPEKVDMPVLSNDQIVELGSVALAIERHYGYPQDIEWAYEQGKLFILQSRRITTLRD